jgi:hypothetical protein
VLALLVLALLALALLVLALLALALLALAREANGSLGKCKELLRRQEFFGKAVNRRLAVFPKNGWNIGKERRNHHEKTGRTGYCGIRFDDSSFFSVFGGYCLIWSVF